MACFMMIAPRKPVTQRDGDPRVSGSSHLIGANALLAGFAGYSYPLSREPAAATSVCRQNQLLSHSRGTSEQQPNSTIFALAQDDWAATAATSVRRRCVMTVDYSARIAEIDEYSNRAAQAHTRYRGRGLDRYHVLLKRSGSSIRRQRSCWPSLLQSRFTAMAAWLTMRGARPTRRRHSSRSRRSAWRRNTDGRRASLNYSADALRAFDQFNN
jgi:hypothetical protein